MKRKSIFLSLIVIILICGCSNRKSPDSSSQSDRSISQSNNPYLADYQGESSNYNEAAYAPKMASLESQSNSEVTRLIVKTADMTIEVQDTNQALEKISNIATQFGGFVVQSNTWKESEYEEQSLLYGEITIRVKAENFDETIRMIENLTPNSEKNVLSKVISGNDITSDYIDTKSRLTSLENTRTKLNEIMATATTAEETLAVYKEIADIESQIEVLKGQIKYMEESAALSSVTVKIHPIQPEKTIEVKEWSISEILKGAVQDLIDSAQDFGEWLIYFVISVLPFLIIIFVPIYFIVRACSRRRERNKQKKAESQKSTDQKDIKP